MRSARRLVLNRHLHRSTHTAEAMIELAWGQSHILDEGLPEGADIVIAHFQRHFFDAAAVVFE